MFRFREVEEVREDRRARSSTNLPRDIGDFRTPDFRDTSLPRDIGHFDTPDFRDTSLPKDIGDTPDFP